MSKLRRVYRLAWDGESSMSGRPHVMSLGSEFDSLVMAQAARDLSSVHTYNKACEYGHHGKVTKVDNPEVRGAFLQVWNDNGNDPTQGESVFADWLAGDRDDASYDKVQRNETAITYLKHCATLGTEPDKHRPMAILSGEGES